MAARTTTGQRARDAGRRARDAFEEALNDLERRLPENVRSIVRDLRANLRSFQQQIERGRHEREARWNRLQTQMRRDVVRGLQRLEKAVAPRGGGSPARSTRAKPRRRKK